MKGISNSREYLVNRKKIQGLEQQAHEVANQIRQMKEDLDKLENLYSLNPINETLNSQLPQSVSES